MSVMKFMTTSMQHPMDLLKLRISLLLMTVSKAMKILYGNSSKEDKQILALSNGKGKEPDNIEIIDAWINRDLLNPSWMQELGM